YTTARWAAVAVARFWGAGGLGLFGGGGPALRSPPGGRGTRPRHGPRRPGALRFFPPMTAPPPPRPAWRPSLLMVANRTRFSPAWPIAATRVSSSPNSLRIAASLALALLPHRWAASRISAPLLVIIR